jgi:hypothetical protein
MTEWREVCRWDVPSLVAEVDNDTIGMLEYREAFDNAIAIIEELAGRYRQLQDALIEGEELRDQATEEGKVSVRPYVRSKPRRSKLVETEAGPTGDMVAEANGHSGASGEVVGLVPVVWAYQIGSPEIIGEVCNPTEEGSE